MGAGGVGVAEGTGGVAVIVPRDLEEDRGAPSALRSVA